MDNVAFLTILSLIIISLISLIGAFTISLNKNFLKKIVLFLVSLAAGTLIGDVFLHIIPHLYSHSLDFNIPFLILGGILTFFALEKILHWRHCHHPTSKTHKHPLAVNNLIADGVHNFVDGLIVGAAFMVSTEVGIATTIAVILHEIPQEIGDFGVLIHAGMKRSRALMFNFLSALLAIAGGIVVLLLGSTNEQFSYAMLAFAAGGFIYIAIADLFPELKHEDNLKKSILQFIVVFIGIVAMYFVTFVEPHSHDEHSGENESYIHKDEDEHSEDEDHKEEEGEHQEEVDEHIDEEDGHEDERTQ